MIGTADERELPGRVGLARQRAVERRRPEAGEGVGVVADSRRPGIDPGARVVFSVTSSCAMASGSDASIMIKMISA